MTGDTVVVADKSESVFGSFNWDDLIIGLANRLRCKQQVKDEEGVLVWEDVKEGGKKVTPLMNERGICHMVAFIYGICQRITSFSNIREDDIERIYGVLMQHSDSLIASLGMNYSDYDVRSTDHVWIIWFVVMDFIEFAVLHAVNEGTKLFAAKAVSETQVQRIESAAGNLLGGAR